MRNSATLAIRGDRLLPELSAALEGSEAGALYSVRVEKMSVEDSACFLEARAKVQEGLAEIAAGNIVDAEEVWPHLEAELGIKVAR